MRKAILTQSYAWVCESCGSMNHVHPVLQPLTEEESKEAMEVLETDDVDNLAAVTHPSIVVCPWCKESFGTLLEEYADE